PSPLPPSPNRGGGKISLAPPLRLGEGAGGRGSGAPCRQAQAAAQHLLAAAGEEAVVDQRPRVALDAALAGGDVGQGAGRAHVAGLARLAAPPRGGLAPLAVGAVDVDAEYYPLVAGGAVAAVLVEGGVGVLAAVHVVERAEEELSLRGALQGQFVAPVGQAEFPLALATDLVAVVAVDAAGRDAADPGEVGAGRVAGLDGRGVAGGADAGAVGVLAQQRPVASPAAAASGVEVAEVPAGGGAGVAAVRPLVVDGGVAVGAVVAFLRAGPR